MQPKVIEKIVEVPIKIRVRASDEKWFAMAIESFKKTVFHDSSRHGDGFYSVLIVRNK
jgi:hypothetical protein